MALPQRNRLVSNRHAASRLPDVQQLIDRAWSTRGHGTAPYEPPRNSRRTACVCSPSAGRAPKLGSSSSIHRAGGAGSAMGPPGEPTLMRRKCGCRRMPSISLTRAKAISASSSTRDSCATLLRPEAARHQPVRLGPVGKARGIAGKARIARKLGPAQHLGAEHHPFPVVLDGDEDRHLVGRLEHAVGRERGMGEAQPLRRHAVLGIEHRHRHPLHHRIEHRHADVGASA